MGIDSITKVLTIITRLTSGLFAADILNLSLYNAEESQYSATAGEQIIK